MQRRALHRVLLAVGLLLAVASVWLALHGVNTFPALDNDEWRFLARYDRFVRYGDLHDRAAFDLFANYGEVEKFPPLNVALRLGVHRLLGSGAEAARSISAAEFVTLGILTGLLAWRYGAPPALAVLAVPFVLLLPSNAYLARTLRFEQDILFFGCLSLGLILITPQRRRLQYACVAASGLLAGAAASMHPYGSAFGIAVAAYVRFLTLTRQVRRSDVPLGALWLAAAALPVLYTAAHFLADWPNTLLYAQGQGQYDVIHQAGKRARLVEMFPSPIPGLPDHALAVINAARASLAMLAPGWMPAVTGTAILAVWTAGAVAVVLVGAAALVHGVRWRPTSCRLAILLSGAAACAFALASIRPAPEYFVYFWCLICVAIFLGLALWNRLPVHARWLIAVAIIAVEGASLAPAVIGNTQPASSAADVQVRAMQRMSELVGLEPTGSSGAPIYADTVSWAGAGVRLAPLYEYLIGEVTPLRPDYDAVILSRPWYDAFVPRIVPFTGEVADVPRRTALMADLLDGMTFAGLLDVDGIGTRLWFVRTPAASPAFMRVERDGHERAWRGELHTDMRLPVVASQSHPAVQLASLDAGRYVAILGGDVLSLSYMLLSEGGQARLRGPMVGPFPDDAGGSYLWMELQSPEDATLTIESHATSPGDVRLRIWRLAEEPAPHQPE